MKITDENVNYMRIALSLVQIPCTNFTAEMILGLLDGIEKKGGDFSLQDAVKIEARIKKKYETKIKEDESTSKGN
jgi:hypothetical protein